MLLDIGMGILLALLISKIFAMSLGVPFIIGSIVFSLIMDVDAPLNLIKNHGRSKSHKHRDLFHLPLVYIPIGMLVIYLFTSSLAWMILFGLCTLLHFIHDSIGIGWGVQWLYPFTTNHYSFFYQYNVHRYGHYPTKIVYTWKESEIDELERKYGDDMEGFKAIYLHPHIYGLTEYTAFIISLIALYFYFR